MTRRRSPRELERALDKLGLSDDGECDLGVAYEDPKTGDLFDKDGDPIEDPDPFDPLVIIQRSVVMPREKAGREGYDILGPADTPQEDVVEVDWESGP